METEIQIFIFAFDAKIKFRENLALILLISSKRRCSPRGASFSTIRSAISEFVDFIWREERRKGTNKEKLRTNKCWVKFAENLGTRHGFRVSPPGCCFSFLFPFKKKWSILISKIGEKIIRFFFPSRKWKLNLESKNSIYLDFLRANFIYPGIYLGRNPTINFLFLWRKVRSVARTRCFIGQSILFRKRERRDT